MDLSVVIVNYNVRQFLESALTSIEKAMQGLEGEILVVDNASDDGSVEMVRSKFPSVRLLTNPTNLGFARANNLALRMTSGDFILLINPDTVVQEDTFRVMLNFFREYPDAGLAGCKVLNPDGSFQLACRRSFPTPWVAFTKTFGLSALFPRSGWFGKYNLTYLSPDETYDVDAVSGSFMMLRREVYDRVGGLDEEFFMYGEDLDWCFRISRAGYKVYYVHSTKIVHFKGESTKRSEVDELKLFYHAMQLFVEKHISRSFVLEIFLTMGIVFRAAIAFAGRASRPFLMALFDILLVDIAWMLGELLYFGALFHFPRYAYPVVLIVPGLTVAVAMYASGVYTTNRHSVSRAGSAVIISYILISASVFFAKSFAFSRAVVLISGFITLLLLPGWRLALKYTHRGASRRGAHRSLFGRRTLIVGTGRSAQEVLRKLRARVDDGYDVLGFVSTRRKEIGDKIAGLEVVGSLENVGKVINDRRVSEVIFSTDSLSYADMLSVIGRSRFRTVNFRLVPNSLEVIIGKTSIDELNSLPLVEIDYNIHKASNRIVKRSFDLVASSALLVTVYPWVWLRRKAAGQQWPGEVARSMLLLPKVFVGTMSFVGRPMSNNGGVSNGTKLSSATDPTAYLGPEGLTSLVRIKMREGLEQEEIEKYELYYAKNQSLALDLEILAKSLLAAFKRWKDVTHAQSGTGF